MSVFDEFEHIYDDSATVTQPPDFDQQAEAEFKKARLSDAETAEATRYFREYKDWLREQVEKCSPSLDGGLEATAMKFVAKDAYEKCLKRLEQQAQIAKE